MEKKILITGGAGFIGSHLCDQLINEGYAVRVLDNLSEQVHGSGKKRPEYLNPAVELMVGDVCNKSDVLKAIRGIDVVYHLSAKVGAGVSMYDIQEYTHTNNMGTATLLEVLIDHPVEKLIVSSSMSVYGEGLYKDIESNRILPGYERNILDIRRGKWELYNKNGHALSPMPISEDTAPAIDSIYALSKFDQERMCIVTGKAYNFPVVALRFFNVYGTRQTIANPYTGQLAIFISRFLNNNPPLILEDGKQKRDYVHVTDVARACILAMRKEKANGKVFNIGSGKAYTFNEIAAKLSEIMGKKDITPSITGKYRNGDVRHCFSDITKAQKILCYTPMVNIKVGLREMAEWLNTRLAYDYVNNASEETETVF